MLEFKNYNKEIPFKTEFCNSKDCLSLNFNVMTSFGLWMPKPYIGTRKEILYRLYSLIFFGFCFFLYILSEIIMLFMVMGDLELMVKAMFLLLTHLAQIYKNLNFMLRRARIQKLLDALDEPLMNEVDADIILDVQAKMKSLRRLTQIFMSLCFCTIVLWAIFPFLEPGDLHLPLMAWIPFNIDCSPNFELMFVYQIIVNLVSAWSNGVQDPMISGIMGLACIQLDNLGEKLRDSKRRFVPLSKFDSGVSREANLKRNKEIKNHFENCIEHHLAIIRFVDETEKIFGVPTLIQFGATTVIICVTAFKIITLPVSIELFSMVLYMVCMLNQSLLYCYYGNELLIKSDEIKLAVYESLWYEQSLENRKLIFIFMERSKRPLKVTALIFVLSLSTFMAILRSSYSYLATLRRLN